MATNIGPKIGIEGFSDYKSQIDKLIQQGKTLQSEQDKIASSFDKETSAEEKNAKSKEVLQRQIETQKERIKVLQEMVTKCAEAYGENDTRTLKWQEQLNKAETALNKMQNTTEEDAESTKDLGKNMDETKGKTSTFGSTLKAVLTAEVIKNAINGLINGIKKLGSALKDCCVDAAAFADNFLTLSATTGLSTDTLQEFQYMSELVDVSLDTITGSMTKLEKSMTGGSKQSKKAFKALGIEVKDSKGNFRSAEDVFYDVINALAKIPNETQRDALAMTLLGKSAKDLNPLIQAGADTLKGFKAEAHETGYVLDSEMLGSLGAMDDSFQRWKLTVTSIKNKLGAALAPIVEKLMTKVTEFTRNINWDWVAQKIQEFAIKAVEAIKKFIEWVKNAVQWLKDHKEWIQAFSVSVAAILKFIVTMAKATVDFFKNIGPSLKSFFQSLGDGLMNICTKISGFFAGIRDGFISAGDSLFDAGERVADSLDSMVAGIASWATNTFSTIKNWALGVYQSVTGAFNNLVNRIKEVIENIKNWFKNLVSGAKSWGKDMISGFSDGVVSKANGLLAKIKEIAQRIRGYLHFSRPDYGPLRDYQKWMPDMLKGMAQSVKRNSYIIDDAMSGLAGRMAVQGSSAMAGATVNMNVYGSQGQNVNDLADLVMRRMYQSVRRKEFSR